MSGKIFGALLFRFPSPPASRILSFAAVLPMRRRRRCRRRRRRCRQRRRTQFANFCTRKRRLSSQTFTLLLLASRTGLSLFLCVSLLHLCLLCVCVYWVCTCACEGVNECVRETEKVRVCKISCNLNPYIQSSQSIRNKFRKRNLNETIDGCKTP